MQTDGPPILCRNCRDAAICQAPCTRLEAQLQQPDASSYLPQAHLIETNRSLNAALLDHTHLLSDRDAGIVTLYYRAGQPAARIAAAFDITRQSVYSALKRARHKIRHHIQQQRLQQAYDQHPR